MEILSQGTPSWRKHAQKVCIMAGTTQLQCEKINPKLERHVGLKLLLVIQIPQEEDEEEKQSTHLAQVFSLHITPNYLFNMSLKGTQSVFLGIMLSPHKCNMTCRPYSTLTLKKGYPSNASNTPNNTSALLLFFPIWGSGRALWGTHDLESTVRGVP